MNHWVALLPEVILSLAAMFILMRDAFVRAGETDDGRMSVDCLVTLYSIAGAFIASLWLMDASAPPDAMIALDGFRVAADVILCGGALLVVSLSRDYLSREGLRSPEFHALVLLALVGMMVLVAARDLILLFVGLELMSISVYVLTGFVRKNPRSSEASLKYFIVGAFASAFVVYGIALLYGATGTTRLATAAERIAAAPGGDLLLVAGIGLLLIGFAFKIAAVPFHMWAPDAYDGAPTPVTSFMATGVKAAAFIALLRVLTVDLGGAAEVWRGAVWWLAILTMIVPNLVALSQRDVKRMLAYSSVAHAGYLLVGVVAASELGRSASLFYLAAYTVVTAGSFAIVFHVAGRGDRNQRVDDYRGLGWRRPVLGAALLVFLLSLAGFPPTAGFVGKLYLLRAAVDAGETSLAVTLVLTSLVAYYYYLRVVWKMYFEATPEDAHTPPSPKPGFNLAIGTCVALILLGGLFPGRIIDRAREALADVPAAAPTAAPAPGMVVQAEDPPSP
ncbi:NADH-quinone oxidoreductase subunit N [Candidatus Palauibacter soopunensis]|uniref:NADH-quinone oxidoreductase subunit N n=1 Tax=Candidatus Palauibacter soopunensis TaxID=3056739 RepID=UPI002396A26F|nr:NADH-quinone oxidoreductase subunit N [Candidatus Palauibacter soopunensis]MDE2880104.1 NADH-quinone oxidoreductase subunit N [Candidatus Palauibacter soopunensis]